MQAGMTYDLAIRGGTLRNSDLIQRRLATLDVGLFASPAYIRRHGTPSTAADLARHVLLRSHDTGDKPRTRWPLRGGGSVRVDGSFVTNDRILLRAAAVAGRGIALLTAAHASPMGDQLEQVLQQEVGTHIGLHVVYPERALLPARARVFIDAVVGFFSHWIPTTQVDS